MRLPAMSLKIASEPKPPGISLGCIRAVPPRLTALSIYAWRSSTAYRDGRRIGWHAFHVLEDAAADAVSAVAVRFLLDEAVCSAVRHLHAVHLPAEYVGVEVFKELGVAAAELEVNHRRGIAPWRHFPAHFGRHRIETDRVVCRVCEHSHRANFRAISIGGMMVEPPLAATLSRAACRSST